MRSVAVIFLFFFFNDTATTEIYTLSLHDALPIFRGDALAPFPRMAFGHRDHERLVVQRLGRYAGIIVRQRPRRDRKSTRLNSSHGYISYAVFCLKKKKTRRRNRRV